jgi:enoyl-CoA hydratase/carnithine racemase
MTQLTQQDGVFVLTLGDDENRFSPDWLKLVHAHLDEVVASPAPLVTSATGKFYSNGLDLDYLMANPDQLQGYVADVQELFARVLALPVPTIAAIPGHAFGAGSMFAMAHDWRVMRTGRGYFCFPEVDINIPFTPGMAALIQAKLTPQAATTAMTTGFRYDAEAAVAAGILDGAAEEADLLVTAIARVQPLAGKDSTTLGAIKSTMYADVLTSLRTPSA